MYVIRRTETPFCLSADGDPPEQRVMSLHLKQMENSCRVMGSVTLFQPIISGNRQGTQCVNKEKGYGFGSDCSGKSICFVCGPSGFNHQHVILYPGPIRSGL